MRYLTDGKQNFNFKGPVVDNLVLYITIKMEM